MRLSTVTYLVKASRAIQMYNAIEKSMKYICDVPRGKGTNAEN